MFAESKVGAVAQTSNGALNLPPFLVCLCGVDWCFSFLPQFPTGLKQCAGSSSITTSSGYLKNIGLKWTASSGGICHRNQMNRRFWVFETHRNQMNRQFWIFETHQNQMNRQFRVFETHRNQMNRQFWVSKRHWNWRIASSRQLKKQSE